jgi:signal transduction histidine kinase
MQILAAISHDLQTPITRMRLRVEALDEGETQQRLLADVGQLSQLVREGIQYARSANVALGPAVRLDLPSFLASLVDDYQDMGKPVQLGKLAAVALHTHPQVLRRVVQNLIDNALAYAGGAEAGVRIDAAGLVCIDVLDNGPGIPEASLDAVLQPFHRLESSRGRQTGGTGLGLAIAQQLTQALGGRLRLANRDTGGLRATVELGTAQPTRASAD